MKKLIIIEKSTANISDLYDLLDPIYDITFCLSSTEGFELIRRNDYDLIMFDILMPQTNGFELLAQIRKLDEYKMTPIILTSDHLEDQYINKGFFLGANEFISRPYQKQLLLRRIKDQLTIADANLQRAIKKQEKSEITLNNMYKMLENLCEIIESKDYSSGTHIMRSGHYYKILVHELMKNKKVKNYFDNIQIDELVMASKMHDIGKIATPDHILNKPSSLTRFEFETMKNHSYNGFHILKRMSERIEDKQLLQYSEQIALSHHEKWNGKGYPSHLKHDEIPLVARIMSVVDVYDALTSKRVYKKALTHEQALDVIKKEKGESFDPMVVDAFIESQDKILNTYKIYEDLENQEFHEELTYLPKQNKNILLIESNPISREVMGNQLEYSGFNISFSASGMDAIMMLKNKEKRFDCVLLDIELPDMDAFEFIQLLRKIDSEIVTFCISDENFASVSAKSVELGFDGCFAKPLDCELLLYRFNYIRKNKLIATVR